MDDLILNIDFAALFADYANVALPASMQGISFRNNLKGKTPEDWRKTAYYRYWQHAPIRPGHFGIRNERYKLAFFYGQPLNMTGVSKEITKAAWEFYDLKVDPNENTNAYNDPTYGKIITEMKIELQKQREYYGDTDKEFPVIQELLSQN